MELLDEEVINQLSDYWSELVPRISLNENGLKGLKSLKELKKFRKRFEINEIMSAMKIATEKYLIYEDNKPTHDSVEIAWKKVGGICNTRRLEKENFHLQRLYYIRGILRNRLNYLNEGLVMQLMKEAVEANANV